WALPRKFDFAWAFLGHPPSRITRKMRRINAKRKCPIPVGAHEIDWLLRTATLLTILRRLEQEVLKSSAAAREDRLPARRLERYLFFRRWRLILSRLGLRVFLGRCRLGFRRLGRGLRRGRGGRGRRAGLGPKVLHPYHPSDGDERERKECAFDID